MNKDNVDKKGKIIVGGTLREKLKDKLKDLIRKKMTEISTSGAAGGSAADGSAGPVKTPYAFGKVKDPTTGLDGYKQVGKTETGTITEKEGAKKSEKSEKEPAKKSEPTPYEPIVPSVTPKTPAEKAAAELSPDNLQREKDLATIVNKLSDMLSKRRLAKKAKSKKTD